MYIYIHIYICVCDMYMCIHMYLHTHMQIRFIVFKFTGMTVIQVSYSRLWFLAFITATHALYDMVLPFFAVVFVFFSLGCFFCSALEPGSQWLRCVTENSAVCLAWVVLFLLFCERLFGVWGLVVQCFEGPTNPGS